MPAPPIAKAIGTPASSAIANTANSVTLIRGLLVDEVGHSTKRRSTKRRQNSSRCSSSAAAPNGTAR